MPPCNDGVRSHIRLALSTHLSCVRAALPPPRYSVHVERRGRSHPPETALLFLAPAALPLLLCHPARWHCLGLGTPVARALRSLYLRPLCSLRPSALVCRWSALRSYNDQRTARSSPHCFSPPAAVVVLPPRERVACWSSLFLL
eukprot:scaffold8637_cov127-Isochrysis_galbana.AAC.3